LRVEGKRLGTGNRLREPCTLPLLEQQFSLEPIQLRLMYTFRTLVDDLERCGQQR
jgi:hypothetical protein